MNKAEIQSIQKIADQHVLRINQALDNIKSLFPLDVTRVANLNTNDIFSIEMLTSRYSKLQDYLGTVVFDALFDIEGENTVTWTPILLAVNAKIFQRINKDN